MKTVQGFVDFVSSQKKGAADERIEFEMIKIDGPLASVWAPYKFYLMASSGIVESIPFNSYE